MSRCYECMYYYVNVCYRRNYKCHPLENICDDMRYKDCSNNHFGTVQYNPFNKVIQCHVCGLVHDWLGKEELIEKYEI